MLIYLVPEETSLCFSLWAFSTKISLIILMHFVLRLPSALVTSSYNFQVFFSKCIFAFISCLWLCVSTCLVVLGLFHCLLSGSHHKRNVTAASEMPQQPCLGAKICQSCVSCLSPKLSFTASGSLQCF